MTFFRLALSVTNLKDRLQIVREDKLPIADKLSKHIIRCPSEEFLRRW